MSDQPHSDHEPHGASAAHESADGHGDHGDQGGHGGKKHHGGHGEGHGGHGGHGGGWIVTYCDMITLLIACFICIITFSSKEQGKHKKKRDSIAYGTGGTGVAGNDPGALEQNAVVWRTMPRRARIGQAGAEMPNQFSDPDPSQTAAVLKQLEEPPLGSLADSYSTRVPMNLLFGSDGRMTESGKSYLHMIAENLRHLPYDIQLQVDDTRNLTKAIQISTYLSQREAIHPGRTGVGVRAPVGALAGSFFLTFVRQG